MLGVVRQRVQVPPKVRPVVTEEDREVDLYVLHAVNKRRCEKSLERRYKVLEVFPIHRQRVRGAAARVQDRVHRHARHDARYGAQYVQQAVLGVFDTLRRTRQTRTSAYHT